MESRNGDSGFKEINCLNFQTFKFPKIALEQLSSSPKAYSAKRRCSVVNPMHWEKTAQGTPTETVNRVIRSKPC